MQTAAGHAAHPHTSRLGDRCETETEGSVEHNTLHVGAGNCNLRTLQQRDGGQVFGFKGLNLLEQILTGAFVGFTSLLHNQIVDFGVGVSVVHEVAVTEERGQIVIRVGVIREPAELVDRVGSIRILGNNTVFVVLGPFGGLQVDLEQTTLLELSLESRILVGGRGSIVVRIVLQLELNRSGNACVLKNLLGLVGARLAVAVTIRGLEGVFVTN